MAFILFFIAVPIELYFLYMDIKLSLHIFYSKTIAFNDYQIHKFFVSRFGNVLNTTFSGLSFLANITAILYLIWKPLDKSRKVNPVSNTLENMDTAKAVRTNES